MINITAKEKDIVEELKRRNIKDVTPKMLEDASLFHRFANARDFNLVEAENMLKKVCLKYVPSSFVCLDKTGCVVRILDCGRTDSKGLPNAIQKKELAKFCAFRMEQDKAMVIKRQGNELGGKKIFYSIYDFEGLTYENAVNMKGLQNGVYILKMFIDNYPESIRKLTVINAPVYFTWMYAVMKPVLPPAVIQKLRVYGKNGWKEALLEDIDADELPAYLGGNRTDPDGNPFCNSFIIRGQPIPKSYYMQNRKKHLALESDVEKTIVMPFSKHEITYEVNEENSCLEWEFETANKDIDFSLYFKEKLSKYSEFVELITKQRIDSSYEPEKGCFNCEKLGYYTIVFDNSYSWFHSKEVYYRVRIKGPKDNELYSSI